jgi:hypothetical protein
LAALGLFVLGTSGFAWADVILDSNGTLYTIPIPGSTDSSTDRATGINSSGQIVGLFGGAPLGFLYSAGTVSSLKISGTSGMTSGLGINDSGQIVGSANGGILVSGAHYARFTGPTGMGFAPFGINDSDQIVGITEIGFQIYGWLYSGGVYTPIEVPGGYNTTPIGINNNGQIVGSYEPVTTAGTGGSRGFVYSNGVYTTFGDGPLTSASGINDQGQVVGLVCYNDNGLCSGYLYSGGSFTTLSFLPSGINDSGQIVGSANVPLGTTLPVVSGPPIVVSLPEPRSLPVLAVCLIGLLAITVRRKLQTKGD